MPIVELGTDYLDQSCAHCGRSRRLATGASTTPTQPVETTEDPYVLVLPPCPACGAREFLIRPRDASGPQPPHHRVLVNQLFDQLERRPDREVVVEAS